ncbi:unnamed protein product, partial [Owenia fusiformis]
SKMAAGVDQNFYQRRLDRTPDRDEFFNLPAEDKKLISNFRSVVKVQSDKLVQLRDENDEKDFEISKEVALRKAAEQRLQNHLTDMYKSPEVNNELRDRLPRSRKTDPMRVSFEVSQENNIDSAKHDDSKLRASTASTSTVGELTRAQLDSVDEQDSLEKSPKKKRDKGSKSRQRHDISSESESSDTETHKSSGRRHKHNLYPPGMFVPPGAQFISPPFPQPYNYYASPPLVYSAGVPVAQSTPNRPTPDQSAYYTPQGTPAATQLQYGNPLLGGLHIPNQGAQNSPGDLSASRHRSHSEPVLNGDMSNVQSTPGTGSGPGVTTKSVPDMSILTGNNQSGKLTSDQNRQITLLLQELDASKTLVRKLTDKLSETEKQLEQLQLADKLRGASTDAEIAAKAAELVDEIYRAQKKRDEAIMGRIQLANQERDEALSRLAQQENQSDDNLGFDTSASEDLDRSITSPFSKTSPGGSASKIKQDGRLLLRKISQNKHRQTDIVKEEMATVIDQRDAAITKAQRLEQEISKLQRSRSTPERSTELPALKAKLMATSQERDIALARVTKLEEELQNVRIFYSLHKSLSQEKNLRDQFNNSLENFEQQLQERDSYVMVAQKENNTLIANYKGVLQEKDQLQMELQKSHAALSVATQEKEKLERLVVVLRRKLTQTASSPSN